ncbi:MAG: sigma-54 dependent transcriptional regulator, partial [Bacteroidia bacterium]|nr:sigma-54 dependent transcriptional regulator [Bacteroidia bacterium]
MNKRLLIVDDDVAFCQLLATFLSKNGFEVETAHHVYEAKNKLSQVHFQFLLLDYRLPDGNGLEVLTAAKALYSEVLAIVMTSFNDIRTAVKAIQLGAKNYIIKPINPDELLMQLSVDEIPGKKVLQTNIVSTQFVQGKSALSVKLHEQIKLIANTELSVIIEGESGTGKENIARQIHQYSSRANKTFMAVDCGTLSENLAGSELFGHVKGAFTGAIQAKKGKLEEANGGTIFLDEIGNLSYDVQIKLLRVIQERVMTPIGGNKEVNLDIRIIAATNDDLKQSIKKGSFREDLYHRLNEFKIEVPPLRQRKEDFMEFVDYFLHDSNTL